MKIPQMTNAQFTRKVREILFIKAKGLEQEMRKHPECHHFYRKLLRDTIDVYKKSGKDPETGLAMIVRSYFYKYASDVATKMLLPAKVSDEVKKAAGCYFM